MESKKRSTTWKKGDPSTNPAGRKKMKHSARTVKGMVERFIKRNITPNKLQAMYDGLEAKDKLTVLMELLPYCAAKQASVSVHNTFEALPEGTLNKLYEDVMGSIVDVEPIQIPEAVSLIN